MQNAHENTTDEKEDMSLVQRRNENRNTRKKFIIKLWKKINQNTTRKRSPNGLTTNRVKIKEAKRKKKLFVGGL